jgi:hypothetical protein
MTKYKDENLNAIQKYFDQIGTGDRKTYLSVDIPLYKMPVGDQAIRILPSLEPGEFFGREIYVHEFIGMNKDYFLCLDKMRRTEDDVCPFCERAKHLSKSNAPFEEIMPFKPRKKVLLNIIDLKNEKDGVKIWIAPYTAVDEILLASYDRKAKTPRDISDPDEGHDIFITREGADRNTKYKGIQMDPQSTSVEQSWLDGRYDLEGILIYPNLKDMEDAMESMAGTVDTGERIERTSVRSRASRPTEVEKNDGGGPSPDVDKIPEEPVDLKQQIASATAGKYGAGARTRTRA